MRLFFRSRRGVLALAAMVFAGACVLRVPAGVAALLLPPGVVLAGAEGTVWNGKAATIGVGGLVVQEDIAWRFELRSLLGGRLEWAVGGRFGERDGRLTVAVAGGGVAVRGVDLVLPLEPFAALHPKVKAARLGGVLHATAGSIASQGPANVSVDVQRVFSALTPQSELGSYRLEIDARAGGDGKWRLSGADGNPVQLAGDGSFNAPRAAVNGRIVVSQKGAPPAVASMLAAFPRDGEGYRIEF